MREYPNGFRDHHLNHSVTTAATPLSPQNSRPIHHVVQPSQLTCHPPKFDFSFLSSDQNNDIKSIDVAVSQLRLLGEKKEDWWQQEESQPAIAATAASAL